MRNLVPEISFFLGLWLVLGNAPADGQEPPREWERRLEATRPAPTAFHATHVIALPTTETLARGEWQFEIAHRFLPAVSEGADVFWGLDGGVNMRLGLGYAPLDRMLLTLARSNLQDNWDLQAKVRVVELDEGPVPLLVAGQAGAAWSSEVAGRDDGDNGNFQYYGQLILNTAIGEHLALGLVPSYLYNVLLDRVDPVQDIYWGVYGQLFLSEVFSVNAEWNLGENRAELEHDSAGFGIELETGGHFFKIFLTNSVRLNPSQFLVGTQYPFAPGDWRLGFAVTRLLRF
jgi:hypothetical protein